MSSEPVEETKAQQMMQKVIPITEEALNENTVKIPKVVFIDNTEAWVDKYTDDALFAQMNTLYQKYKHMETNLQRARTSLKQKFPDIQKTLEMVAMLKSKHDSEEKELTSNFLLADNIWAKSRIPNTTGKVGLWLGANVMVEYSYEEAIALLSKNMSEAEKKIKDTENDIDFLKD